MGKKLLAVSKIISGSGNLVLMIPKDTERELALQKGQRIAWYVDLETGNIELEVQPEKR